MSVRVIFVDIDNTIYSWSKKRWDMKSISYLRKLSQKGIKIVISTSRPLKSAKEFGAIDLVKPDGVISFNGGAIIYGDELIYSFSYPKDKIVKIIEVANKYKLSVELCGLNSRFMTTKFNTYSNLYFKEFVDSIPPYEEYKDQPVISLLLCAPKDMDEVVKKEIGDDIHYIRFGNYGVDIHQIRFRKGDAVKKMLDYLQISRDDAAAFGDENADISMFENVKFGVALGNATDEVKNAAYYVTKPVHKHGVYKAIKKLKLDK